MIINYISFVSTTYLHYIYSVFVGAFVFVSFIGGCATTAVLLSHKEKIVDIYGNVKFFLGYKDELVSEKVNICFYYLRIEKLIIYLCHCRLMQRKMNVMYVEWKIVQDNQSMIIIGMHGNHLKLTRHWMSKLINSLRQFWIIL